MWHWPVGDRRSVSTRPSGSPLQRCCLAVSTGDLIGRPYIYVRECELANGNAVAQLILHLRDGDIGRAGGIGFARLNGLNAEEVGA